MMSCKICKTWKLRKTIIYNNIPLTAVRNSQLVDHNPPSHAKCSWVTDASQQTGMPDKHNMWDSASCERIHCEVSAFVPYWNFAGVLAKKMSWTSPIHWEKRWKESVEFPNLGPLFAEYHPSVRSFSEILWCHQFAAVASCIQKGPKGPCLQEPHQSQNPGSPSLRSPLVVPRPRILIAQACDTCDTVDVSEI